MARSPGQAAYEKWIEHIGAGPKSKVFKPLHLEPWARLQPNVRATWESVAQAAIDHARRG